MSFKRKNENGITLIALIITIITTVIIAAAAINLMVNNGVIEIAINGAERHNASERKENEELGILENQIKLAGGARDGLITEEEVNRRIAKAVQEALENTLTEEQVNQKISEAVSNATKQELLWENPNKSSAFTAQTVSWNTDEYNRLYVIYKNHKDDPSTVNLQTEILYPDKTTDMRFIWAYNSNVQLNYRHVKFDSNKKSAIFGGGLYKSTASNDAIIPLYIIGFKSPVNI